LHVISFAVRVARNAGSRSAVRMITPTREQASRGPSVASRLLQQLRSVLRTPLQPLSYRPPDLLTLSTRRCPPSRI
jgi:hypothetical protein